MSTVIGPVPVLIVADAKWQDHITYYSHDQEWNLSEWEFVEIIVYVKFLFKKKT